MDSQYPTAPELPGRKVPQLVTGGKPPEPDEPDTPQDDPELSDEPADESEEATDELNEHVEDPGDPDGVVAAEEEQKREESRPVSPGPPKPAKRKRRWPLIITIGLLVIVAAVVAYKIGTKKVAAPSGQSSSTQNTQTDSKTQEKADEQAATVPTKTYESTTYALSFDYPETWTVSDTAAKLTVTSPSIQLKGVSGSAAGTHIVVSIQNPQTTIPGYPASGATATLASEKLTYKQPTAAQRAQTYLTYAGYKSAGLDALYITGDNGYQQGQNIPMSDVIKGNPLVSVVFQTCSTVNCSSGTPTTVTLDAAAWQSSAASKQVTDLLQSLQFN